MNLKQSNLGALLVSVSVEFDDGENSEVDVPPNLLSFPCVYLAMKGEGRELANVLHR